MSQLVRRTLLSLLAIAAAVTLHSWMTLEKDASSPVISLPAVVSAEASAAAPVAVNGCSATVTCAVDGSILSCNGGFGETCSTRTSTINVSNVACLTPFDEGPPEPLATVKVVQCGSQILPCPRCPSPF